MWMVLMALGLIAASGLPSVCVARQARGAAIGGGVMVVAGAVLGMIGAILVTLAGVADTHVVNIALPLLAGRREIPQLLGHLHLALDPLAAFFLLSILFIGAAGTLYGLGYWRADHHPRSGPLVRLFYGTLVASLGLVVLAQDGVTFLIAWELMSLSAFAAIVVEDHRQAARQAGWLYLVNTHLSMLVLFAMFALWRWVSGSYAFVPLEANDPHAGPGIRTTLFLLALVGFGAKAGMMPLHFWLPDAHANAPSHVSALLSGVVIKMGIYGLIRVGMILLPEPPLTWGVLVLGLGIVSGVLGVVFALAQHDLKRLLAYHSIENIGIILMGLGIALIGAYAHEPAWTALGLAGCLLHVWNHGLFKSLLFLAAGGVIMKMHTRQIDRLGGLARTMPLTAGAFVLGAVAICGLPPLNGFVSEWLVYMGILGPFTGAAPVDYRVIALAAPALALIGTLAVACFVKVYGTVFLGLPRHHMAAGGDLPATMLVPMGLLALACLVIGVFPTVGLAAVMPAVSQVTAVTGDSVHAAFAPVSTLGLWTAILAAGLLGAVGLGAAWMRRRSIPVTGTWDCGYAVPTVRMQYTASSFGASILELFRWVLRPHGSRVKLREVFPERARYWSHVGDAVLDRVMIPAWGVVTAILISNRALPQGSLQRYLMLIWLTLAALLASLMPWQEWWAWLLARG